MKNFKRFASVVMVIMMMLSMMIPAMAAGETGTITITNASAGQTYNVYKVFDATYNEETEAVAYAISTSSQFYDVVSLATDVFDLTAGSDANTFYVSAKEGADVLSWLKTTIGDGENFTADATKTAEIGEPTVEFNVAYGYYYITSSLGTTVTVNQNTPSVNVIDKNTTGPAPDENVKVIVKNENTTVDNDTAAIGEDVNFKVSFTATNMVTDENGNVTWIEDYTVTDIADGLEIDTTTIEVKVGDKTLSKDEGEYTVTENEEGNVVINIKWATITDDNPATETDESSVTTLYTSPIEVTITYTAEVVKAGTATNKVKISYNDTPFYAPTEPDTEVKNYQLTVNKVDGQNNNLTGAKFEIYDAETEGTKINLVKEEDGTYRLATTEEAEADGFVSAVIEAGTAVIKGFDGEKTYWLEETVAPAGYNKLTERKEVKFTVGATEEGVTFADNISNVVNQSGTELPSTGGIGTTIFYCAGAILAVGAFVLLITKKRMSKEV